MGDSVPQSIPASASLSGSTPLANRRAGSRAETVSRAAASPRVTVPELIGLGRRAVA